MSSGDFSHVMWWIDVEGGRGDVRVSRGVRWG